jgi:nucleotide-binding universal stress UspA family protein
VRIGHDVCKRHGIRAVEHFEESEWAAAMIAIAADVDADLVVVGSTVESSGQEVLALELRRSLLIVHTG